MFKVEHLLHVENEIGESPIWVPEENSIYWCDTEGYKIFSYEVNSKKHQVYDVEMPVEALGKREKEGWLLVTKEGFGYWDPKSNECAFIADPEADKPDVQFNDGTTDKKGRYLVGSFNFNNLDAPDGSLYILDENQKIKKLDSGLALSNGICFSLDGKTLYLTEMAIGRISVYDYDLDKGTVSNKRTFAEVDKSKGKPDGLIIDSEGFLWSAHWGGSRITRYDPSGKIDMEIMMPVSSVTCMAFGGESMDELYVTTAWYGMSKAEREKEKYAGDLFKIKTGIKGILEYRYKGERKKEKDVWCYVGRNSK